MLPPSNHRPPNGNTTTSRKSHYRPAYLLQDLRELASTEPLLCALQAAPALVIKTDILWRSMNGVTKEGGTGSRHLLEELDVKVDSLSSTQLARVKGHELQLNERMHAKQ